MNQDLKAEIKEKGRVLAQMRVNNKVLYNALQESNVALQKKRDLITKLKRELTRLHYQYRNMKLNYYELKNKEL